MWRNQDESPESQRERLELVLEGTRLGMWDWNPQTNEVVFDERWAQMLGHSLDEIDFSLESWSSRVHPDDLEPCLADIQAHIEGRTDFYENVHRMRHADGRWVYILDRGRIVARDADGRPIRFTGTHTDITAQCEAERRARELAHTRTQFLARMSHEIRTPLHGMLGVAQLLDDTGLTTPQERLLKVLSESGETLLVLINDIIDFARADDGALQLAAAPFDVGALLTSIVDLFRPRATKKGLRFTHEADLGPLPFARGDAHRVRQVLSNLVSNAIKFTADGAVKIVATRAGNDLHFDVIDTGPGIIDTERIFLAYEQEDPLNAGRHNGAGLGLAIVQRIVESMGGEIGVESRVGLGSRFWVRIPAPSCDAPAPVDPRDRAVNQRMRVLVADDNPINQLVIQTMLANAGHDCETVDTGAQALQVALREPFDCIFLDLHMPELGGVEVASRLRRSGFPGRLVAASADAMLETQAHCRAVGFDDFLAKPFSQADLLDRLHTRETAA
ncbi:MAG: PAS domain-containing protein [Myxococcales bacterium]|nr:PAS domain-containing protein [Myxococcales bacterium]